MVDGVAASVYIDFLGSEAAAHRSAAKYRLLARAAPRLVRWLHARGLNQPLLLVMARALPEVSSPLPCAVLTMRACSCSQSRTGLEQEHLNNPSPDPAPRPFAVLSPAEPTQLAIRAPFLCRISP